MPFTGKILLIDDEPHIRKYLALIARELGAPVIIRPATAWTLSPSTTKSRRNWCSWM